MLAEIVFVLVILYEILILFTNSVAKSGIFNESGQKRKEINSFEVNIFSLFKIEFMTDCFSNGLDLELLISNYDELILSIAFKHSNVLNIPF